MKVVVEAWSHTSPSHFVVSEGDGVLDGGAKKKERSARGAHDRAHMLPAPRSSLACGDAVGGSAAEEQVCGCLSGSLSNYGMYSLLSLPIVQKTGPMTYSRLTVD